MMARRDARSPIAAAVIAAACCWVLVVIVSRMATVPLWDGRVYASCVMDAAASFSVASLRCAGHASQAYVLVAAAMQRWAIDSYVPLYVGNVLLIGAAVAAFFRL